MPEETLWEAFDDRETYSYLKTSGKSTQKLILVVEYREGFANSNLTRTQAIELAEALLRWARGEE